MALSKEVIFRTIIFFKWQYLNARITKNEKNFIKKSCLFIWTKCIWDEIHQEEENYQHGWWREIVYGEHGFHIYVRVDTYLHSNFENLIYYLYILDFDPLKFYFYPQHNQVANLHISAPLTLLKLLLNILSFCISPFLFLYIWIHW